MALASYSCNLSSFSLRHSHRALPSPSLSITFQKRCNLNLARCVKLMSLLTEKPFTEAQPPTICGCGFCNKRQLLDAFGVVPPSSFARPAKGDESADMITFAQKIKDEVHPSKPDWYEKLYAMILDNAMKFYEAEFAGYKVQLLNQLKGEAEQILELGIGTGPNIQYYASGPKVSVVGVDPNKQMEKYSLAAATAVGIPESQFKFICGVGEALPVLDSSMDAVVCTLVLCSVKDVEKTLKEVQRVLKPGGRFIFIEHVAAPDGTLLRFWQNLLDPLQQFFFDGCHLARQTGKTIIESGFSEADVNMASIKGAPLVAPIVYGTAYK